MKVIYGWDLNVYDLQLKVKSLEIIINGEHDMLIKFQEKENPNHCK